MQVESVRLAPMAGSERDSLTRASNLKGHGHKRGLSNLSISSPSPLTQRSFTATNSKSSTAAFADTMNQASTAASADTPYGSVNVESSEAREREREGERNKAIPFGLQSPSGHFTKKGKSSHVRQKSSLSMTLTNMEERFAKFSRAVLGQPNVTPIRSLACDPSPSKSISMSVAKPMSTPEETSVVPTATTRVEGQSQDRSMPMTFTARDTTPELQQEQPLTFDDAGKQDSLSSSPPLTDALGSASKDAGKRRRRTSPQELQILEEAYKVNTLPSSEERLRLSKRTGMSPRAVQIWFQNKRQTDKRRLHQAMYPNVMIIPIGPNGAPLHSHPMMPHGHHPAGYPTPPHAFPGSGYTSTYPLPMGVPPPPPHSHHLRSSPTNTPAPAPGFYVQPYPGYGHVPPPAGYAAGPYINTPASSTGSDSRRMGVPMVSPPNSTPTAQGPYFMPAPPPPAFLQPLTSRARVSGPSETEGESSPIRSSSPLHHQIQHRLAHEPPMFSMNGDGGKSLLTRANSVATPSSRDRLAPVAPAAPTRPNLERSHSTSDVIPGHLETPSRPRSSLGFDASRPLPFARDRTGRGILDEMCEKRELPYRPKQPQQPMPPQASTNTGGEEVGKEDQLSSSKQEQAFANTDMEMSSLAPGSLVTPVKQLAGAGATAGGPREKGPAPSLPAFMASRRKLSIDLWDRMDSDPPSMSPAALRDDPSSSSSDRSDTDVDDRSSPADRGGLRNVIKQGRGSRTAFRSLLHRDGDSASDASDEEDTDKMDRPTLRRLASLDYYAGTPAKRSTSLGAEVRRLGNMQERLYISRPVQQPNLSTPTIFEDRSASVLPKSKSKRPAGIDQQGLGRSDSTSSSSTMASINAEVPEPHVKHEPSSEDSLKIDPSRLMPDLRNPNSTSRRSSIPNEERDEECARLLLGLGMFGTSAPSH